jgi:hypothetical protein
MGRLYFEEVFHPCLYLWTLGPTSFHLSPSKDNDDVDDEDDSGARSFLDFSIGGGGGIEECSGEGGMARFSDGRICDAHLANWLAAAPKASSSSSSIMVRGLLAIFLICSPFCLQPSFHLCLYFLPLLLQPVGECSYLFLVLPFPFFLLGLLQEEIILKLFCSNYLIDLLNS